eukprot:scaffold1954_cov268-Pinguiococcus_pyrenoidosus.AAC.222
MRPDLTGHDLVLQRLSPIARGQRKQAERRAVGSQEPQLGIVGRSRIALQLLLHSSLYRHWRQHGSRAQQSATEHGSAAFLRRHGHSALTAAAALERPGLGSQNRQQQQCPHCSKRTAPNAQCAEKGCSHSRKCGVPRRVEKTALATSPYFKLFLKSLQGCDIRSIKRQFGIEM